MSSLPEGLFWFSVEVINYPYFIPIYKEWSHLCQNGAISKETMQELSQNIENLAIEAAGSWSSMQKCLSAFYNFLKGKGFVSSPHRILQALSKESLDAVVKKLEKDPKKNHSTIIALASDKHLCKDARKIDLLAQRIDPPPVSLDDPKLALSSLNYYWLDKLSDNPDKSLEVLGKIDTLNKLRPQEKADIRRKLLGPSSGNLKLDPAVAKLVEAVAKETFAQKYFSAFGNFFKKGEFVSEAASKIRELSPEDLCNNLEVLQKNQKKDLQNLARGEASPRLKDLRGFLRNQGALHQATNHRRLKKAEDL
jgi:hypothetical protein